MDEEKTSNYVKEQENINHRTTAALGSGSLDMLDGGHDESTGFARAFLPVKLSAVVFGMWFAEGKDNCDKTCGSICGILGQLVRSTVVYNVIICTSLALNVIRHIIAFWITASGTDKEGI